VKFEFRGWFVTGLVAAAALLGVAALPAVSGGRTPRLAARSGHPVRSCASLASVSWPDGSRVTSAVDVPASGSTPEFCNVTVLVPDHINIYVDLPTNNWNGRYQAMGNGGFAGAPTGTVGGLLEGEPQTGLGGLAAGYAESQTDTGHQQPETGAWAWSPTGPNFNQIQDFAYRANHEMALKSKDLIGLFYGRAQSYSYWMGCSTGGREGLTEAMRYPNDFDGIVAESPAINWTRFIPAEEWPALVMNWNHDFLPACKEAAVTNAVMAACNGTADGARDGLIDPRNCHFDPKQLIGLKTPCGTFTAQDAAVVEQIWQGPRGRGGQFLWYGLEPGADLGSTPSLSLAGTASVPSALDPTGLALTAVPFSISDDWLRYFIHQDPSWNYQEETYQQYIQDFQTSVTEWASDLSTDDANLSAFRRHGGKVIIWHGLADQLIFPQGTINYYTNVLSTMGGLTGVSKFARLYLSPNSPHCGTGALGPYPNGPLEALVKWREQGIAPATLTGSGTNPAGQTVTRNICPYPERTIYNGSGDVLVAGSFHCSGPSLTGAGRRTPQPHPKHTRRPARCVDRDRARDLRRHGHPDCGQDRRPDSKGAR
jgi:Tannase and feruloyl esterase